MEMAGVVKSLKVEVRMSFRLRNVVLCSLAAWLSLCVSAQSEHIETAEGPPGLRGVVLREAVDPCLGLHWQWMADPSHPEWPYHLVLVDKTAAPAAHGPVSLGALSLPQAASALQSPVIRAGELITVLQQTGTLTARLQALALDSASAGHALRVRLTVSSERSYGMNSLLSSTGPIITVTAEAPGRAVWPAASERSTVERQKR